MRIDDMKWISA